MIFSHKITITADTAAAAYQSEKMNIDKGFVYRVEVEFPPGPSGLSGVQIHDGGYQVWPTTPGQWFVSDAHIIGFDDSYLKAVEPWIFEIRGYNTDTLFNHSVFIRIGLVSAEVFMARFLPTYTYKYFKQILVELEAQQEARRDTFFREVGA
jgi:hypothetical protein